MRRKPNLDHVKDYLVKEKIGYQTNVLVILESNEVLKGEVVKKHFDRITINRLIQQGKLEEYTGQKIKKKKAVTKDKPSDPCNFGIKDLEFPENYTDCLDADTKKKAKASMKKAKAKPKAKRGRKMLKGDNKKIKNSDTKKPKDKKED